MSMIIEKATHADALALLEFLKQIGGESDNLSFGAEGIPIPVEAEAEYLTQLENSRDNVMFLAKEQGTIIGNASLNRLPRRMSHRGDLSIAVAKDHWNQGVGKQLLSKIIDFAKSNSFELIDLQVRSDNLPAIHLYESCGFRKICTYQAFFKIGDQEIDFDYMCLSLK